MMTSDKPKEGYFKFKALETPQGLMLHFICNECSASGFAMWHLKDCVNYGKYD